MKWRLLVLVGVVFFSIFSAPSIKAEEATTPPSENPTSITREFTGGISVYGLSFQLVSESEALITLSITNSDTYSAGTLFTSIEFTPKVNSGEALSTENAVVIPFSQPVTMYPGETRVITERVRLPRFLDGDQMVFVNIYNENGRLLIKNYADTYLATPIPSVDLAECRFGEGGPAVIPGMTLDANSDPIEGIVVCALRNADDRMHNYSAELIIHNRLFVGETLYTGRVTGIVGAKEITTVTLPIGEGVLSPGLHYIRLAVTDETSRLAGKPLNFSIDQAGPSAMIDFLHLDKGKYEKGETAIVNYKVIATGTDKAKFQTALALVDTDGKICAETTNGTLGNTPAGLSEVKLSLTADCTVPVLTLTVRQDETLILDQKTISAEIPTTVPRAKAENERNWLIIGIATVTIIILVLFLLWNTVKNRRNMRTLSFLLGLALSSGLFFSLPNHAQAAGEGPYAEEEFHVYCQQNLAIDPCIWVIDAVAFLSFNKTNYAPGENVVITAHFDVTFEQPDPKGQDHTATFTYGVPSAGWPGASMFMSPRSGGGYFPSDNIYVIAAPTTPGFYPVVASVTETDPFYAGSPYQWGFLSESIVQGGFTVDPPSTPAPTVTLNGGFAKNYTPFINKAFASGSGTMACGQNNLSLTWNSTDATSCAQSILGNACNTSVIDFNNPNASTSGSKSYTRAQLLANCSFPATFRVVCTGPGGTALDTYTLNSIDACVVPVNGVCGPANGVATGSAPSSNLCQPGAGTPTPVSGTGPWSWQCLGSNGGSNANCSAPVAAGPVNGVCGPANGVATGSAPSSGLCTSGAPSSVSGSGPWSWSCNGSNGGSTASCSAPVAVVPVNGICSSTHYNCIQGTSANNVDNGGGNYSWMCRGSNGGTDDVCLEIPGGNNPIGTLDIADCTQIAGWTCDPDNFSQSINAHLYDGAGFTNFIAGPLANGTRADVAGACGGTTAHGFSIPTPAALKNGVNHSIYAYGINILGGSNAVLNGVPKILNCPAGPPAPVCGPANNTPTSSAPSSGLCSIGSASSVTGSGPWNWTCTSGGNTVNCSAPPIGSPVNGVCGPANGVATGIAPSSGLCSVGASTLVSGSGPWTWNCLGSNGGSNASCSAPPLVGPAVVSCSVVPITNTIASGGSTTLNWSSTNATSCLSLWDASLRPTAGNTTVGPIASSRLLSLRCTDGISTATCSQSVIVSGGGSNFLVCPDAASVAVGSTQQFRSYYDRTLNNRLTDCDPATLAQANIMDYTLVSTWSSLNPGIATVGNAFLTKGRATGVSPGNTTITATHFIAGSDSASLTVTGSGNQPPTPPIIAGAGGTTGQLLPFTFLSTDPDGDTLRYGVDWNMDSVVDQFLPGLGYTASGTTLTGNWSWPSVGLKTFQAYAQDNLGSTSAWAQWTVTIIAGNSSPVATIVTPPAGATYILGSLIPFLGTGTDSDGSIAGYAWYGNGTCAGVAINANASWTSNSYALGPHTVSFQVRDNLGALSNCDQRTFTVIPTPCVTQCSPTDPLFTNTCKGTTYSGVDSCGNPETCPGGRACDFNWKEIAP